MSEKSLLESAWKSFASKQKLKDTTVTKSLNAHAAVPAEDFARRLKALAEIETAATTLRRSEKDNDDVEDYLIDILNGVRKERKTVQAEQRAHEKEKEEDEEEEEPAGAGSPEVIKKRMTSLMGQVKTKSPEDKQLAFMALLGKGGSAVLLAKAVGAAQKKVLLEIAPKAANPKFHTGECRWEENTHTFVLEKVPSGIAKKLAKALLLETGLKYKVRVRSFDGSVIVDSDTEPESVENEAEEPTATPAGVGREAFIAALSAIKPNFDKVLAAQVPATAEVRALFAQIAGRARNLQFDSALADLPKLEQLVRLGLGQITDANATPESSSNQPTPSPTVGSPTDLRDRLAALVPAIRSAMAADSTAGEKLRLLAGQANGLAKIGDLEAAFAVIADLEQQLNPSQKKQPTPILPGWNTATTEAASQLESLRAHLRQMDDGHMKRVADGPLAAIAERLATSLREALGKFDQQTPGAREALPGEVAAFRTFLSSKMVGLLDINPFSVKVALRQTLEPVLSTIEQATA